ncbi:MAG: hypothetical protein AAF557_13380 [Pseudomonadota bacterium]
MIRKKRSPIDRNFHNLALRAAPHNFRDFARGNPNSYETKPIESIENRNASPKLRDKPLTLLRFDVVQPRNA